MSSDKVRATVEVDLRVKVEIPNISAAMSVADVRVQAKKAAQDLVTAGCNRVTSTDSSTYRVVGVVAVDTASVVLV